MLDRTGYPAEFQTEAGVCYTEANVIGTKPFEYTRMHIGTRTATEIRIYILSGEPHKLINKWNITGGSYWKFWY